MRQGKLPPLYVQRICIIPDLRTLAAGDYASLVGAQPAVRTALLAFQREFGRVPRNLAGAVLDGRDIGTVIFPDAPKAVHYRKCRNPRGPPSGRTKANSKQVDQLAQGTLATQRIKASD